MLIARMLANAIPVDNWRLCNVVGFFISLAYAGLHRLQLPLDCRTSSPNTQSNPRERGQGAGSAPILPVIGAAHDFVSVPLAASAKPVCIALSGKHPIAMIEHTSSCGVHH